MFGDDDNFGLKQLFSSNIVLDNQVIGGVDSYVITGQPNPKVSYSNNDIPMSAIYTFTSNVSNADNFAFKKANGTYWTTTPPYSPNSNTIVAISGVQQQINLGALGKSISFNKGTKSNIWISNSGQLILDDSSTATSNIILVFSGVTLGTYPSSNVYYGLATTTNTDDALVITYKDVGINPGTGSAGNLYAQVVLYCDNSPLSGTYELNYGSLNTPFGTNYNYYVGCQGNLSVLATQLTASMVETNFGRYPYYNTVFKKANNEMSICMDIDQNMNYFNMSNVKGIYGTGFRSNGSSLQYSVGANGGKWSNFVGGVDSQVQFNDGGVASGDSGLTFTKSSKLLTVSGNIAATYNISAGANIYGQSGLIVGSQYTSNPPTMNSTGLYNIGSVNAAANSNLDIRSTTGNVNITANGDIILTSNSPSTIKLVGPGNSPMVSISQDAGGNTFMSFGSTTGEAGYGIKADATGNVLIKSQGAAGWAGVSNTQISIAGRTVELGGSNTIGFDNLTGNIAATQISPTSITNAQLVNSNVIVAGKTVALGSSATIGFSDLSTGNIAATQISPATITNTQLVNSNIVIGGQTINLGGSGSLEFSNITGSLNTGTQIVNGNIANAKLANSNIVIGGQTINLGGSGSLEFSNITGSLNTGTQIVNGNIANAKLANSNIVIGGQTINLGSAGSLVLSNISDVSSSDALDGSLLRWDSTALLYYRRRTQYYSYAAYGQLASYSSATQKAILLNSTWASRTVDTTYSYPAAKFTISGTGSIGGFDSNKVYKIEFHISQNSNNISTTMSWRARIFGGTTSAGTVVRDVSIGSVTDDRAPSLHCVVIIGGYTSYYFDYGITAGTYSTTVSPDCQISISFNEI